MGPVWVLSALCNSTLQVLRGAESVRAELHRDYEAVLGEVSSACHKLHSLLHLHGTKMAP